MRYLFIMIGAAIVSILLVVFIKQAEQPDIKTIWGRKIGDYTYYRHMTDSLFGPDGTMEIGSPESIKWNSLGFDNAIIVDDVHYHGHKAIDSVMASMDYF